MPTATGKNYLPKKQAVIYRQDLCNQQGKPGNILRDILLIRGFVMGANPLSPRWEIPEIQIHQILEKNCLAITQEMTKEELTQWLRPW